MNAHVGYFPRVDASGSQQPRVADIGQFLARADRSGIVTLGNLGPEIANDETAKRRAEAHLTKVLGPGPEDQERRDAATDFVTSGLSIVLGAGDDLRRGEDKPYLFVPGRGQDVLVPSQNKMPFGARDVRYRIREGTGQAKFFDPNDTRGLQRAGSQTEEAVHGASYYGIEFGTSVPETWEADILGENLEAENERAAVNAMDEFRESVSFWGDTSRNIPGFGTASDAVIVLMGQQFSSGGPNATTQLERLSEIELLYSKANGNRMPTHMLAPPADKARMQNTYLTGTSDSVWKIAVDRHPWVANARWDHRLDTANAGATAARWIIWTQDMASLYIEHHETKVFGPFQDRFEMCYVLIRRIGGLVNKKPEQLFYADFTV